jgi:hypothetical protein
MNTRRATERTIADDVEDALAQASADDGVIAAIDDDHVGVDAACNALARGALAATSPCNAAFAAGVAVDCASRRTGQFTAAPAPRPRSLADTLRARKQQTLGTRPRDTAWRRSATVACDR